MIEEVAVNPVTLTREYLMMLRTALLMQLDALERLLGISPTTAEIRKEQRALQKKSEL
jgi:hypothetical protein